MKTRTSGRVIDEEHDAVVADLAGHDTADPVSKINRSSLQCIAAQNLLDGIEIVVSSGDEPHDGVRWQPLRTEKLQMLHPVRARPRARGALVDHLGRRFERPVDEPNGRELLS